MSRARRPAPLRLKLLALALGLLVSVTGAEMACRWWLPRQLQRDIFVDERNIFFAHDSELGWVGLPNVSGSFDRSVPIDVRHNPDGFRDEPFEPTDDKILLALGDSLVWGYDAQEPERFTELIAPSLKGWTIRNVGVSGYGTDQQLLLLKKIGPRLRPAHVFHVQSWNDREDNTSNLNFGNYYKPYFVIEGGRPVVKGIPVPRSLNFAHKLGPFRWSALLRFLFFNVTFERDRVDLADPTLPLLEELHRYATQELGATFSMGLTAPDDREVAAFCERHQLACVDLSRVPQFPGFGQHWTPEGQRQIALRVQRHLHAQGIGRP